MSTTPTGQISAYAIEAVLNEGIVTNYPGGKSPMTFNDILVRKLVNPSNPSSSGTSISMSDMRGKAGPSPIGTFINNYCSGTTLVEVIADGRYSSTTNNIANSPSCRATITGGAATISQNQTDYTINVSTLPGYSAGNSDITITVNSGIYVYSTSTSNAGLTITGATAGDTIKLINNGYILGKGGKGAGKGAGNNLGVIDRGLGVLWYIFVGFPGGPALSIGCNITVINSPGAYIAGGGGGGNGSGNGGGGGGGAGGGEGGVDGYYNGSGRGGNAAGGGPGQVGANGVLTGNDCETGSGGGRILPGTGGAGGSTFGNRTKGGGAGGGAGVGFYNSTGSSIYGGAGGSAGNVGGTTGGNIPAATGGGGWGAAGGISAPNYAPQTYPGAPGGAAIKKNGYVVSLTNTGTIYGAVL